VLVATRRRQWHIGQLSLGGSSRRAYIKASAPPSLPSLPPFVAALLERAECGEWSRDDNERRNDTRDFVSLRDETLLAWPPLRPTF